MIPLTHRYQNSSGTTVLLLNRHCAPAHTLDLSTNNLRLKVKAELCSGTHWKATVKVVQNDIVILKSKLHAVLSSQDARQAVLHDIIVPTSVQHVERMFQYAHGTIGHTTGTVVDLGAVMHVPVFGGVTRIVKSKVQKYKVKSCLHAVTV